MIITDARDLSFPTYEQAVEDALSSSHRADIAISSEDHARSPYDKAAPAVANRGRWSTLVPLSRGDGAPALPPGRRCRGVELFDTVRSGDKVTIVTRFGQIRTGRAVMRARPARCSTWGVRHGTPAMRLPITSRPFARRRRR